MTPRSRSVRVRLTDAGNVVSGSPVFAATIAARKIIVASPATNAENAARQRPFRWVPGQDPDAAAYLTASFVGRSLSGEKAKWAGDGTMSSTGIFEWYWGPRQGSYAAAYQGAMSFIYSALQYAGPTLTPNNVEKGSFSVPGTGGASNGTTNFRSGYGKTVGLPYDEYALLGTDRNLASWNPDITAPANAVAALVGKGKFMYLNGAKRYGYGQFPEKQPRFFDKSVSVAEIPRSSNFEDGVVPADNPCPGCPVNGGTGAP